MQLLKEIFMIEKNILHIWQIKYNWSLYSEEFQQTDRMETFGMDWLEE